MGLLRLAVGVGVIVLLLPSDEGQQQRLYQNAAYAVERATTFCDRNAKTCETAGTAWGVFVRKLEFGAKLVYDMATSSAGQDDQQQPRYEPAVNEQPQAQRTPPPVRYGPQRQDDPQSWRRSGT
jgi:hypothetical protein